MSKIIDVMVIVFPDGTTHWFRNKPAHKGNADPNVKYLEDCLSQWKSENEELIKEHPSIDNAVCMIRMPEEKYNQINADGRFMNEPEMD